MLNQRKPRLTNLAIVLGLHGLAFIGLMAFSDPIELQVSESRPILASIITPSRPSPAVMPTTTPVQPRPVKKKPTQSVLAAPRPAPVDDSTNQPPERIAAIEPKPETPRAVSAAEVIQPKFDANYLNNPKPPYPSLSRRLGEEGVVLLRVYVDVTGQPEQIQMAKSSGFERLDAAALQAVARWKFVPARQGKITVAAWVQVPISFQLRR
jgi:protein TonB